MVCSSLNDWKTFDIESVRPNLEYLSASETTLIYSNDSVLADVTEENISTLLLNVEAETENP